MYCTQSRMYLCNTEVYVCVHVCMCMLSEEFGCSYPPFPSLKFEIFNVVPACCIVANFQLSNIFSSGCFRFVLYCFTIVIFYHARIFCKKSGKSNSICVKFAPDFLDIKRYKVLSCCSRVHKSLRNSCIFRPTQASVQIAYLQYGAASQAISHTNLAFLNYCTKHAA